MLFEEGPAFADSNGQQDCSLRFNKNGRYKKPIFVNPNQRKS